MSIRYNSTVSVESWYHTVKVQIFHYNVVIISPKCSLVTGILQKYLRGVSVSVNKVGYLEAGLTHRPFRGVPE
jgi:hypothetical protein